MTHLFPLQIYGKIIGKIQLLKKTITIALNALPDIIARLKTSRLYLLAPAIIGITSPSTGIHGERNIMSHPYLSNNMSVLSSVLLLGTLCNLLKNLLPLLPI